MLLGPDLMNEVSILIFETLIVQKMTALHHVSSDTILHVGGLFSPEEPPPLCPGPGSRVPLWVRSLHLRLAPSSAASVLVIDLVLSLGICLDI